MLEDYFRSELNRLSAPGARIEEYWTGIKKAYSAKSRHYHNLNHLEQLLNLLVPLKNQIDNWSAIVFAIAYHDIIYKVLKSDNEEQSALLADLRLSALNADRITRNLCVQHIRFTKSHGLSDNPDTNLFTDTDLSVLGSDPQTYTNYAAAIRKEYRYYTDIVYNPGRRKVLNHFLKMDFIFKTDFFRDRFEAAARVNLINELVGPGGVVGKT